MSEARFYKWITVCCCDRCNRSTTNKWLETAENPQLPLECNVLFGIPTIYSSYILPGIKHFISSIIVANNARQKYPIIVLFAYLLPKWYIRFDRFQAFASNAYIDIGCYCCWPTMPRVSFFILLLSIAIHSIQIMALPARSSFHNKTVFLSRREFLCVEFSIIFLFNSFFIRIDLHRLFSKGIFASL